jgi:hypothetical protein
MFGFKSQELKRRDACRFASRCKGRGKAYASMSATLLVLSAKSSIEARKPSLLTPVSHLTVLFVLQANGGAIWADLNSKVTIVSSYLLNNHAGVVRKQTLSCSY